MTTTVAKFPRATFPPTTPLKSITPPPFYDSAKFSDERNQKLHELLLKGHMAVAPLRDPQLIFHSHLPHLLGSAYALGADSDQLIKTYEHEIQSLKPTEDEDFVSNVVITKETWRKFLQQKKFTVAYVRFFDEEVRKADGDWKKVLNDYLFFGAEPLINGYTGGLGHPFIHLAYAYELQDKAVATQALSLGCTEYDPLHTLVDNYPEDNSTYKTTSLVKVLSRILEDSRFNGIPPKEGYLNMGMILQERKDVVLEHWNAWEVDNPTEQLQQVCDLSVLLGLGSGSRAGSFDFYHVHIMTVAHALLVLWDVFPDESRVSILRQYALFTILTYIMQMRRPFDLKKIEEVRTEGKDWNWVISTALNHKWALDAHFFKVVRAPKVFEDLFGSKGDFYLKAAIKFVTEFDGWEGFGDGVAGLLPDRDGYIPE